MKKIGVAFLSLILCCGIFCFAGCNKTTTSLSNIYSKYSTTTSSVQLNEFFEDDKISMPSNLTTVSQKLNPEDTKQLELLEKISSCLKISEIGFNNFFYRLKLENINKNLTSSELNSLDQNLQSLYTNLEAFKKSRTVIENEDTLNLSVMQHQTLFDNFVLDSCNLTECLQNLSYQVCSFYKTYITSKTNFTVLSQNMVSGFLESEIYINYFQVFIPTYKTFISQLKNANLFYYNADASFNSIDNFISFGNELLTKTSSDYDNIQTNSFNLTKDAFLHYKNICSQNNTNLCYFENSFNSFNLNKFDEHIISYYSAYNQTNVKKYLNEKCSKQQKGHYNFICDVLSNNCQNILNATSDLFDNLL